MKKKKDKKQEKSSSYYVRSGMFKREIDEWETKHPNKTHLKGSVPIWMTASNK